MPWGGFRRATFATVRSSHHGTAESYTGKGENHKFFESLVHITPSLSFFVFDADYPCRLQQVRSSQSHFLTRNNSSFLKPGRCRYVVTINLKTAVDFNAEAQRCRVTQRKSKVLWGNGKYDNFSDGLNLHQLGVACMVLQK